MWSTDTSTQYSYQSQWLKGKFQYNKFQALRISEHGVTVTGIMVEGEMATWLLALSTQVIPATVVAEKMATSNMNIEMLVYQLPVTIVAVQIATRLLATSTQEYLLQYLKSVTVPATMVPGVMETMLLATST